MISGGLPEGLANFRDVGQQSGIAGILRPGRLYRSESPQFLTEVGAAYVAEDLGVRLILDLRFHDEALIEGRGPLADREIRYLNLPVMGSGGDDMDIAVPAGESGGHVLAAHYISYLRDSGGSLVTAVRELAGQDGLPALVHCAAGKDRTGLLVALVLDVLGVGDEAIIADYARTGDNMRGVIENLRHATSYAASIASHIPNDERSMARPESMGGLLAWLRANHGSAEHYLVAQGLEPVVIAGLRRQLSDQAAA